MTVGKFIKMLLPLVNVFERPYEVWEYRDLNSDEICAHYSKTGFFESRTRVKIAVTIQTHNDAALYVLKRQVDIGFESHIDRQLRQSSRFLQMLNYMPSDVPEAINDYKKNYASCDLQLVSFEIERFGHTLSEGQIFFHGGLCRYELGETFTTQRPMSTSFCPQVALRNAEWRGKAYDAGEVHLFVLKVASPRVKAFVFHLDGELGNEKELLISATASLTVVAKSLIKNDYDVCKSGDNFCVVNKNVPAYLIELEVK